MDLLPDILTANDARIGMGDVKEEKLGGIRTLAGSILSHFTGVAVVWTGQEAESTYSPLRLC